MRSPDISKPSAIESLDSETMGRICVHAILGTSAARHIDLYRLTELVRRYVVAPSAGGGAIDINRVVRELLKMDGVTERGLFIGLVNMVECLSWSGVRMALPPLALSEEERRTILETAEMATHSARAAFELRRLRAAIHRVNHQKIGSLLVQGHHISEAQLERALAAQRRHGRRLGTNLVEMGFLSAAGLARFLGHQLGLECVMRVDNIDASILALVPRALALHYRMLPIGIDEKNRLRLAMEDPLDIDTVEKVQILTNRVVHPLVIPETLIQYAMGRFYGYAHPSRLRR